MNKANCRAEYKIYYYLIEVYMCKFPDVFTSLDWTPKWGLFLLQFRVNVSEPICQSFMRISFLSFPAGTSPGFPRILLYPKPFSVCFCPATGVRTQMCPLKAGGLHTVTRPGSSRVWSWVLWLSLLNPWNSETLTRSLSSSLLPPVPECISPLYWVPRVSSSCCLG